MPEQHCDICREIPCENPVDVQTYSLESPLVFTSGTLSAVAFCPVGFTCSPGVSPHTFTYDDEDWTIPVPPSTVTNGGPLILKGCSSDIVRFVTPGMTAAQIAALAQEMFAEAAQQQADCDMVNQPGVTREPEPPDFTLSALSPSRACLNTSYSGSILSTESVLFSVIGSLPPGLTLSPLGTPATSANLTGTPTTSGTYVFVVKAEFEHTVFGHQEAFRQVTFQVLGFTTASALPDGGIGTPYSETLATTGLDSPTFSVASGSLPTGLSLNTSTGEISGTPIEDAGTFTFTVTATDAHASCSQQFSIEVPGVDYSQLVWSIQSLVQAGSGTAEFVSPGAGGTGSEWVGQTAAVVVPGFNQGRLILRATMPYAGPNFPGRVVVTVSNNNDTSGGLGGNQSLVQFFINAVFQTSTTMPTPPPTFNGVFNLNFTASAGTLLFVIDMITSQPGGSQPSPMTFHIAGSIINV